LLMSIGDNLPLRYVDPDALAEAYDFLSQADVFRGRIGMENWHLLKYFFNCLSLAAAVQPESYQPFKMISPPIRIISLFWTKGKRTMLDGICGKIGSRCNVSKATAKQDFVPMLKSLITQRKADDVISWLELAPEEVDFLANINRF